MEYLKINNDTIKTAVKEWFEDESIAETLYGHISNWDTSEVTDMNELFLNAIVNGNTLELRDLDDNELLVVLSRL